jgi:toxin ParE1/3/4
MIKIIVVSNKAEVEIRKAAIWYDEQSPGLSERFIKELDYFLSRIENAPHTYKMVDKNIHRCLMKIFPYVIFFTDTNNEIVILRVRHKKQKQLKRYK